MGGLWGAGLTQGQGATGGGGGGAVGGVSLCLEDGGMCLIVGRGGPLMRRLPLME